MKRALAVVAALALALALGGWALHARAARPRATVEYYYIPGCAVCVRTAARLRDVVEPYGARVALRLIDCTSEEGAAAVERYRFRSHGLALVDEAGRAQLVESDHRVFPEHVAEALDRLMPGGAAVAAR